MNTEQYEVVWHGGKHREYPQPTIAPPQPAALPESNQQEYSRVLLSILTHEWMSYTDLRRRVSRQQSTRRLAHFLGRLVKSGRVQMQSPCVSVSVRRFRKAEAWEVTPETRILRVLSTAPTLQATLTAATAMDAVTFRKAMRRLMDLGVVERERAKPCRRGRQPFLYRRVQASVVAA